VKCDEGKPACKKCLSTGRKCDGYGSVPSNQSSASSSPTSLSLFSNVTPREHRAFEYFLSCTGPELSGYFSREIYSTQVPKLSFSELPLWHIVIALSSVHEGYAHGIQDSNRDTQLAQYSFGLKHYSFAVKSLKEAISSQPENIESVLLCSMLFVCFDSLRGNYTAASTHLNSGLKILCSEKDAGRLSPSYARIIEQFTCLGVSTGVFIDSHLPESNTHSIWSQFSYLGSGRDNSNFKTIDDARHNINMILNDFMLHHTMSQNTDDLSGYKARMATSTTRAGLAAWNRNFDAMILRQNPTSLSSDALRGSILMKLHHASLIAIVNGVDQVEGDALNAPYHTIVTLARSLVNANVTSKPARTKANISSDLGLVSPLFVTISRCTVPELRREALELLKAVPRREGLWDAEIVARIAIEVLGIEERENQALITGEGETGELDMKVQELRIQKNEDYFGEIESAMKVDLGFERMNRVTGQREMVTETLFI
jgi:hypothetical protein